MRVVLNEKKPWFPGLFLCARVDSNHHPVYPQGPQPCASTNSATSAERASIARLGDMLGEGDRPP